MINTNRYVYALIKFSVVVFMIFMQLCASIAGLAPLLLIAQIYLYVGGLEWGASMIILSGIAPSFVSVHFMTYWLQHGFADQVEKWLGE